MQVPDIGFVATMSSTYNSPYNLARRTQSTDIISGGRLIITDYAGHRVFVLAKPDAKPQEITVSGIESAADLAISPDGKSLIIPDMGGGKLATLPMPK